ncbi:MAG TPA: hypothetical protein VGH74_09455 [Planctomycetaceae bacterium]
MMLVDKFDQLAEFHHAQLSIVICVESLEQSFWGETRTRRPTIAIGMSVGTMTIASWSVRAMAPVTHMIVAIWSAIARGRAVGGRWTIRATGLAVMSPRASSAIGAGESTVAATSIGAIWSAEFAVTRFRWRAALGSACAGPTSARTTWRKFFADRHPKFH